MIDSLLFPSTFSSTFFYFLVSFFYDKLLDFNDRLIFFMIHYDGLSYNNKYFFFNSMCGNFDIISYIVIFNTCRYIRSAFATFYCSGRMRVLIRYYLRPPVLVCQGVAHGVSGYSRRI